ncbi:MAG: glycoside hydrolase family 31 protein [Bacilli bacterium]|nr:glycoside hydrolase family 31 protein [Bacilli bacterium]
MYNLGSQFVFDYEKAQPNPKAVIKGKKYRFTILTERLIRLEYNESGVFDDRPTELVWFRNFSVPEFKLKEDERFIELSTKYFTLHYVKEKKFNSGKLNPTANLKVDVLNSDRYWYYNHPEVRNYGAPATLVTNKKGKLKFNKGLYSIDGFASIDDSHSKIMEPTGTVKNRETKTIDIYLFVYLKDFELCLKDYFMITGFPALLPRYALGNWWSRNIVYNDNDLKELITNFERKEIPVSVLLLDKDWHVRTHDGDNHLKTGFTWNKEFFRAPYEMIAYIHSKGIRIGLNINPMEGLRSIDEYYEKARTYLEADANGVIPFNILNPRFVDTYLKLFIHPLDNLDIDFFWIDYFEKNKLDDLWLLKHYHFYDMMRNYKRRPMVLGYNSLIAPHRYPVLYSGKTIVGWDALKLIPAYNSNASNNGVSWWSHDIGGYFKGIEDNELYIRYVQLGTFSPILKFGADNGKYYKREPWRWNIKTYTITQDYMKLRHRLIPYLYTEAYRYHKEGIPLIQPIYYKYPELYDDTLYRNEYYLGNQLFVAPIIKAKDHVMNRSIHKFFIPDGIWYDFVTGKKFPGGKNYVSFFKDQDYPVFAKTGSIIPLGENENINDTTPPKNMEIHIFPGKSNVYRIYEDDGMSNLYLKGYYLISSIEYNYLPNNYTVIIRALEGKSGIAPDKRNYTIRFRNTKRAEDVIAYFNNDQIEYEAYNDGPDFVVSLKEVPTIGQLTLNCKGKDIEIDAIRLIKDDIEGIISDLQIETLLKEKIDAVLFSDLPYQKKRIAIRRLSSKGLEKKFIKLFLKLLEYINEV